MSKQKLITEHSLEELLASLDSQEMDMEIKISFDNPILSFIQAFKIQNGIQKVSDKLLYQLFKLWNNTRIDKRNFNIQLSKYIDCEIKYSRRMYLVDISFLNVAEICEKFIRNKKRDKTKSLKWKNHFDQFIEDTKLTEGQTWIEGDILYYIYNNWLDSKKKKTGFTFGVFMEILHIHFETTTKLTTGMIRAFKVNRTALLNNITREEVERWRLGRQKISRKKTDEERKSKKPKNYIRKTYRGKTLFPEKIKQTGKRSTSSSKKRIHIKKPD